MAIISKIYIIPLFPYFVSLKLVISVKTKFNFLYLSNLTFILDIRQLKYKNTNKNPSEQLDSVYISNFIFLFEFLYDCSVFQFQLYCRHQTQVIVQEFDLIVKNHLLQTICNYKYNNMRYQRHSNLLFGHRTR